MTRLPRTTPLTEALLEVLGIDRTYLVDEDAISISLIPGDQKVTVTFTWQAYLDALGRLGVSPPG